MPDRVTCKNPIGRSQKAVAGFENRISYIQDKIVEATSKQFGLWFRLFSF